MDIILSSLIWIVGTVSDRQRYIQMRPADTGNISVKATRRQKGTMHYLNLIQIISNGDNNNRD
jgi:hypothetical protein